MERSSQYPQPETISMLPWTIPNGQMASGQVSNLSLKKIESVESVKFHKNQMELMVGETRQLEFDIVPTDSTEMI